MNGKTKNVILHFGAVDYDAMVWVQSPASLEGAKTVAKNSDKPMSTEQIKAASYVHAGRHRGGFSPFSLPLLDVKAGDEITIVLRARDDLESPKPRGKQSQLYQNHGCMYYRTTGIWQTVWLEPVPEVHLLRPRLTPDVSGNTITLEQPLSNVRDGLKLRATIADDKGDIESITVRADMSMAPQITFRIPDERVHLWQAGDGFLYNINIELLDGETVSDKAKSYAGLRSVAIDGKAIKINGEAVFQRLVLDQGFYEDGIFTAPSDEALIKDIELSIEAGFNGARLHQKVFEERFLYHADRMGYLCWGEFADWGCRVGRGPEEQAQYFDISYAEQWLEVLERDYSKPSIVGWCALNETWEEMTDEIRSLDSATRALWLCAKTCGQDATGFGCFGLFASRAGNRYLRLPRLRAGAGQIQGQSERFGREHSVYEQALQRRPSSDEHAVSRSTILCFGIRRHQMGAGRWRERRAGQSQRKRQLGLWKIGAHYRRVLSAL